MNYQIELLSSLLHDFIGSNSTIMTFTGDILAVNGPQPDIGGTLPVAGKTVGQYFKLEEGDVVLLNDPYSGGSTLGEFTFVVAVSDDLLWLTRRSLTQFLSFENSIEKEGLRIPPTPIRQKGQVNEAILQAMMAHPACPSGFSQWVQNQLKEILNHSIKLQKTLDATGFSITSDLIESYLLLSRKAAAQRINEGAFGETRVDVRLDTGELLRLNMDIHESQIRIDFGGTSATQTIALTEAATYGVCLSTIGRFYGFNQIGNSGTFSVVQVTKPSGCWLNAKYPAAVQRGFHTGVSALIRGLELALNQIHFKEEKSPDSHCAVKIELRTSQQRVAFDLPGGQGANSKKPGRSARLKNFSIEKLEKEFPIQVLNIESRARDLTAKTAGGSGIELRVKILAPLEVLWMTDLTAHCSKLTKECTAGEISETFLFRDGKEQNLGSSGQKSFATDDILVFRSGNGGSFGKATQVL